MAFHDKTEFSLLIGEYHAYLDLKMFQFILSDDQTYELKDM
jgi:hypothetical protein